MSNWPDDEDGAVLASLEQAGVDLSKPLEIEFAIAAPDEAAANKIAAAVRDAGHPVDVVYDDGEPHEDDPDDAELGPSWTVCVPIEMQAEHARIVALQAELDAIAKPQGGEIDGWGVIV